MSLRLSGIVTGTRLLTPEGYRPVETLSLGDLVRVMLGDEPGFRPITWIGRRHVILSRRQQAERPVRVRRHAAANGVPDRDVYLAQQHAVYWGGKLCMVRDLVNGRNILLERRWTSVEYWGVQLQAHSVLLADGLPVESLLPECTSAFTPVHSPGQAAGRLNLDVEVRTALNAATRLLIERGVKADVAVQPQLGACMPRHVFQDILTSMLDHAILATSDTRILVAATKHQDRVRVTVTFESRTDRDRQDADLQRLLEEAAAPHGARFSIAASPPAASTLSLDLPADGETEDK